MRKPFSVDSDLVEFLKESLEGSNYYNEQIITLFSKTRYIEFGDSDYSELPDAVDRYKKFYSKLEYYLSIYGERNKLLMELRYGLKTGECKTLAEVGNMLGVSGESVRLIEANMLRKLALRSVYNNVKGIILDKEELDEYEKSKLIEEHGEEWYKIKTANIYKVVGKPVYNALYVMGIKDLFQLRDYILNNIKKNNITEKDIIQLFTTLKYVKSNRAEASVKRLKESGFYEFVINREVQF